MTDNEALAERTAQLQAAMDESRAQRPVRIIRSSLSGHGEEYRRVVSDAIGQAQLEAWEEGFESARRIALDMGAVAVAEALAEARDAYWRSEGVDL